MESPGELLPSGTAARALSVAREVGERLRDAETLARAIAATAAASAMPDFTAWDPATLSQGHAGLALTFAQLDALFPGGDWHEAAHDQVALAVRALKGRRGTPGGLASGLAGLAFAARAVDATRYQKLLVTLDGLIARHADHAIARIAVSAGGVAEDDYDVMSGLAGMGAYALEAKDVPLLRATLEALVRLVRSEGSTPGWYTPVTLVNEIERERFPAGRLNCGLAHGLPGPLALFALAAREGIEVAGQREAARRAAEWLVAQAIEDETGLDWPASVPLDPAATREGAVAAGWCYGAPGVAHTLWLAGEALGASGLQRLANSATEAVFARPPERRRDVLPGLCHGLAGLLNLTALFARETGRAPLRGAAAGLADELLGRYRPESILGYRSFDAQGNEIDQAGLLEGAPGVALALLSVATSIPAPWHRAFLLG